MTADEIELIITEVLRRLRKKVLIVLTNAGGYKKEIYTRLSTYQDLSFSILIASAATEQHCAQRWGKLGKVLTYTPQRLAQISSFDLLLLPFLDFKTVGDLANGIIHNEVTELISHALLKQRKVVAFDYNCNPNSELNSILGLNQNPAYTTLLQQNMAKISQSGINFIVLNELEGLVKGLNAATTTDAGKQDTALGERFVTMADIRDQKISTIEPGMKLTDLALEYIKENKIK